MSDLNYHFGNHVVYDRRRIATFTVDEHTITLPDGRKANFVGGGRVAFFHGEAIVRGMHRLDDGSVVEVEQHGDNVRIVDDEEANGE